MKVLMLGRIGLLKNGGGDKVQIENTAKELVKLGVEVDIKTGLKVDLTSYDLVHVFQLDWTPETYLYAEKVKQRGKPLVLSPIHHAVREVQRFDDVFAFDFRRLSRILFHEQHSRDTFKNVYRSLFDFSKAGPTFRSVRMGLKNMHAFTLQLADHVLVQTVLEAKDLRETYGVEFPWTKVPNGVGAHFLSDEKGANPLPVDNYLLCVGRIEPRKNQLNIIKAVKAAREESKQDLRLVFVGKKSARRHFEYILRFNLLLRANPWVIYVPEVPYKEMPALYSHAKVGISASWFETTGLTSLEALFCGSNAVAAGERAREYLGSLASYCDPGDVVSIKEAILRAYDAPPPKIPEKLQKEYTWRNAAQKTLKVYKDVLK